MNIKNPVHNFIMYFMRMVGNLLFTIFIFSYVSRIIGPDGVGKVQYYEIINKYFLLFINLGICGYAQREIAINRHNPEKVNKLASELLFILLLTTGLGTVLYLLFINVVISDTGDKIILYIYLLNIVLNLINVEWFYLAYENQTYITKRDFLLKIISGIFILIFVKEKSDIYIYICISILGIAGASIFNFFNFLKHIKLKKIYIENIKAHLKPIMVLFASGLALSISYNLDSVMVKQLVGETELGYYVFVNKIGRIPVAFVAAVIAVTQTRMANLIGNLKIDSYKNMRKYVKNIILFVIVPVSFIFFLASEWLIMLTGGIQFKSSIILLRVFSIYVLVVAFSYITGSLLIANKKDKIYSISLVGGSLLNFIFNIIFISKIGALGAIIATIITEIIAILIRISCCKNIFFDLGLFDLNSLKIFISSILMSLILGYFKIYFEITLIGLIEYACLGGILYILFIGILKEELFCEMLSFIKYKLQKN